MQVLGYTKAMQALQLGQAFSPEEWGDDVRPPFYYKRLVALYGIDGRGLEMPYKTVERRVAAAITIQRWLRGAIGRARVRALRRRKQTGALKASLALMPFYSKPGKKKKAPRKVLTNAAVSSMSAANLKATEHLEMMELKFNARMEAQMQLVRRDTDAMRQQMVGMEERILGLLQQQPRLLR